MSYGARELSVPTERSPKQTAEASSNADEATSPGDHIPSLEDSDYRAHAEFRYAIRRFLRYSEDQARALDLTPQQHLLLLTIRGHPNYPDVGISDVAERLQIRHHSASLLVDRAVQNELLTREKDPDDRRRVIVALTPKGAYYLSQITQANRKELKALEGALFTMRGSLRRALQATDVE